MLLPVYYIIAIIDINTLRNRKLTTNKRRVSYLQEKPMRTFEEVCVEVAEHKDRPGGIDSLQLGKTELLVSTFEMYVDLLLTFQIIRFPLLEPDNIRTRLASVHSILEADTYRVGLDLRQSAHTTHPLTLLWRRWESCNNKIKNRYAP